MSRNTAVSSHCVLIMIRLLKSLKFQSKENYFQTRSFFFFHRFFFSRPFTNHRTAEERGGYFVTPHYNFHSLHRHLDISRAIIAGSSPPHICSSRTRTRDSLVFERKSLTTKLRALNWFCSFTVPYLVEKGEKV